MGRLTSEQRALVEANADLLDLADRIMPGDPDARSHAGLALVQLAAAFDPGRGVPFRPYARAALAGRMIDARRREQTGPVTTSLDGLEDLAEPDVAGHAISSVERSQLLGTLAAAWLALPEAHRRAVERLYAGQDHAPSRTTRRARDAALRAVVASLAAATGTGRGPRRADAAALAELLEVAG